MTSPLTDLTAHINAGPKEDAGRRAVEWLLEWARKRAAEAWAAIDASDSPDDWDHEAAGEHADMADYLDNLLSEGDDAE